MKVYENGLREATEEEIAEMKEAERQYWLNISYGDAVNIEIRKRYTDSQEFAILRQKEEKPEEYTEYYNYCEQCKVYVKEMKREG